MSATSGRRPDRSDPLFAPYWDGSDRGELVVQRCANGHVRWPPRPMCARCHSTEIDWTPIAGAGTLFSWTNVEHQTVPGMRPPYVVALVELARRPTLRMLGRLVDVPESRISIGMQLTAVFEPSPDLGVTLVHWTEAPSSGTE